MASRGAKRTRSGKDKSPAAKQRRLEDRFMKVMDLVATGQAQRPGSSQVFGRPSQTELKGCDVQLTQAGPLVTTVNTNGDSTVLNLIQSGSASFNRIGRKIFMKNLRLKGIATYRLANQTTTSDLINAAMRMVVVYDRQTNGALPAFQDIFAITAQDATETGLLTAPVRYDATSRFRVLRDVIIKPPSRINPATGGSTNIVQTQVPFDEFVPLRGLETLYKANSSPAVIGDIDSGGLYVYFRALGSSVDDKSDWSIDSTSWARLRYTD